MRKNKNQVDLKYLKSRLIGFKNPFNSHRIQRPQKNKFIWLETKHLCGFINRVNARMMNIQRTIQI